MDAYAPLSPSGVAPSLFLEMPLLGEAHCDTCAGPYRERGSFVPTEEFAGGDVRCAELARWVMSLVAPQDLLFGIDLDPQRPHMPVSGAYVRHMGNLSTARELYSITGSAAGFDGIRRASERLPEGWHPILVGDYFGRANTPLRLETTICPDVLRELAIDAQALRDGLGRMGVPFVDDETIALCQGLFRLDTSVSFQFDVYADGSLAGLLSATLFFRDRIATVASPDEMRRITRRSMSYLRDVGVSDGRCRMFEEGSFSLGVPGFDDGGLPFEAAVLCEPHCCKLKWVDGVLQPARWYQILKASIGPAVTGY